jgi:hypothetical protein
MGFHVGVIGARCTWETLKAELEPRSELSEIPYVEDDEDWDLEVFQHAGGTVLIDNRLWLTQDDPDLHVQLSAKLATVVCAFYAETISGSYGLLVAKAGKLRRLYHRCNSTTRGELSVGQPYTSEAIDPLNEINGNGGLGVLEHYGFLGPHLEDAELPKWRFRTTRRGTGKRDGPIARTIAQFDAEHAISAADRPSISAVGRVLNDDPNS